MFYSNNPSCDCGITDDYSVCLSTDLHLAMEEGLDTVLVALDVAGAFDKVWWKALLEKLEVCGCRGLALKLLKSYFKDRMLYVVVMGVASALKRYRSGVPQGGVWSPKLWNFFIQDLISCCKHTQLFMYADDCTVKLSFKPGDRQVAISQLNEDLKRVSRWGRRWKTTFEPTKTHAMLVSNKGGAQVGHLEFDGVAVGFEQQLKIVGVIYDAKLNWSKMAEEMASRGRRALGFLKKLRHIITSSDIGVVYKYFVRSKMEFGCLSYMGAAKTHLERLDEVQHRAEVLSGASFQSLWARRRAASFGLLCKVLDGACVEPMQEVFSNLCLEKTVARHQYNTSHSRRFEIGGIRVNDFRNKLRKESLETFKRSFICKIRDIFDDTPDSLKELGAATSWLQVMKAGQSHLSN